jgi:hypothetical protein
MIRNGVIDAQKEFAERRYRTVAGRNFEQIKRDVMDKHGIDIECCRETYFRSQEKLFAVIGNLLVETYSNPARSEPWAEYKQRNGHNQQG